MSLNLAERPEGLSGSAVLPALAAVWPQLYLTPGPEGAAAYKRIVQCGEDAPSHSLSHFHGSGEDAAYGIDTPAGRVLAVTLGERADFELFLQIMAFRCSPTAIPRTQGASILDGVINWTRIRAHEDAFRKAGGSEAAWSAEFKRFTAVRQNYTDALIVLSRGPYSAVEAEAVGLPEREWLAASHRIREAHECTHFLCRRLFPDRKDAIWDELVADAVGLYAAFGRYDRALAERFLGMEGAHYVGGRLENYVPDGDEKPQRLEQLAQAISDVLGRFETIIRPWQGTPFELAIQLENQIGIWSGP